CENKEVIIYLFLFTQEVDLETIKNIFSQMPQEILEKRIKEYFNNHNIKFLGKHIKIVYRATIVKDFHFNQISQNTHYPQNVVSLYR
ncbi:MAG: hypothetical protein ACRCST_04700, partial [Turicibacter sp.]